MRSRRRTRALVLALICIGAFAGCNVWPGDLGEVPMPYTEARTRELERQSFEAQSTQPPQSMAEGLEELRNTQPSAAGEPPLVIRDLQQDLFPLSLEQLRLRVLRDNLKLQVELLKPEIARTKISEEEGKFDAIIGGNFQYQRKDTPPLDGPLVQFTSDNALLDKEIVKLTEIEQSKELIDMELGVMMPLPTGAKIKVDGLLSQKDIFEPQNFEQYVAATRFSISQPLLRGGGTRANLARVRMARVGARSAEVRTKLAALRILATAEKAYWKLYAARRVLDVRAEQYRLATENLRLVQQRAEVGQLARVEVVRSQLGVAKTLEKLIVARTQWQLRQRELKEYLAAADLPVGGEPLIDTSSDPLLAGLELDTKALVDRALRERLDLIDMELAILRDGLDIERRENDVLPIANLDFKYGLMERDQAFGNAFADQWDFENQQWSAGISFEVPFTNQQRRARLENAILTRARALASKRAQELMVRREVYNAADMVTQNWQRIVAARQTVIVAGVNYDFERQQFDAGFRTMREVFEALTELGDAQLNEVKAVVEYQGAQIDLAFATGTLLGYAGVDLEPLELQAPRYGTRD